MELGPGTGQKAAHLLSLNPASYTAIDNNPASISATKDIITRSGFKGTSKVIESDFLDYKGTEKYDLVIKGRFDINIHDPLIIQEDPNVISIPPGYDWKKGVNDIFAYGGRDAMVHYCNMFDFLESYIIYDGVFFHAETLLKHHLFNSEFGVERPDIRISLRSNNVWEHEIVQENFKKI